MGELNRREVTIGARRYALCSDDQYLTDIGDAFEPHMVRLFQSLIRPGDTIVDVGANIGCTALLFSQLGARVHAFEPCLSTFALLERNVRAAGAANVALYPLGLGDAPSRSTITYGAWNRSGGFVSNQTQADANHTVEAIEIGTLDHFAAAPDAKIDFIKIDVEGFERSVLQGAAQVLARDRPVVALELNHFCLNALQRITVPDFLDFLRGVFPILCAVEGHTWRDLHDPDESWQVTYEHIVHFKYATLVGAFEEGRLAGFRARYRHGG